MKKHLALPAAAIVCGVVGCILRICELKTGFEPDTGLALPGAPAAWALILCSAAVFVLLLLLARRLNTAGVPAEYGRAFAARNSMLYIVCMVLAAFALLGAGVLLVLAFLRGSSASPVRLILAALCILSCFCVLYTGKCNYRTESAGKFSAALLLPAYTCCLWLIVAYQIQAGNPVQLEYIYGLFAIIAALLSQYYVAGFSFERPKPRRAILFTLLAIYFSIVTLADRHDSAFTALYLFVIFLSLASAAALLSNLEQSDPQAAGKETDWEESADEP